ncbi:MAG: flagellar protein FlbB [Xanthobacteraceae bacterium]
MIRYIRDLRLIPIALIASVCLLTLKVADIALHGSTLLAGNSVQPGEGDMSITRPMPDGTVSPGSKSSWAQQMFNFPDGGGAAAVASIAPMVRPQIADRDYPDITGSVKTEPANADPNKKSAADTGNGPSRAGKGVQPPPPKGTVIPTNGAALPTGAERAILERLQQRREELDDRAHALDIRESLIQNAEKRMDAKLAELKQVEEQIKQATQAKNDAEKTRLKDLVVMYENMKSRDAAKIFNGLDPNVLLEVAALINPRTMAEIAAQMSPDVAQRLTVELAEKAQQQTKDGDASAANLPKIQGQPTTQ